MTRKDRKVFDITEYKGKKVFVTGHTGFKGSWMCQTLLNMGAEVTGYALDAPTCPSMFDIIGLGKEMNSLKGDIRDGESLVKAVEKSRPEIIIHMAAQPLVRESYRNPAYTYATNVMGTVNILECVRNVDTVRSFVNVTTDKVYLNKEWEWGYRENEELNGYDPYSNSKSCSELITGSYKRSFFQNSGVAISTVRAGNVIGGGDFAVDRIIPDCVRAVQEGKDIVLRNPMSVRPYQHILEPIMAYLMIAIEQYNHVKLAGTYNVGPDETSCVTTGKIADLFCEKWKKLSGRKPNWVEQEQGGPHEAHFLKLDCSKIKETFNWHPVWEIDETIEQVVDWYYCFINHEDMISHTVKQIEKYLEKAQMDNTVATECEKSCFQRN